MALKSKHFINIFITKILWILFLIFQESILVTCGDLSDDSLKKALESIERRQRDIELQENEYYGQPENIGYGFQKALGFFDSNGPATELGSFSANPKNDNELQNFYFNYQRGDYDKRKSNFRERMANSRNNFLVTDKNDDGDLSQRSIEYLEMLKNLWSKYRRAYDEDLNLEDLKDEQVEDILRSLYDSENTAEEYDRNYERPETNFFEQLKPIPLRNRKNYRVFEEFNERRKRYPSFGEGFYGKRNVHLQDVNYENPLENEFLYSLKYVNPQMNRDAIENFKDEELEILGNKKDNDIVRILDKPLTQPKFMEEDEPFRSKARNRYEEDIWYQHPVVLRNEWVEGNGKKGKQFEISTQLYKSRNDIDSDRFPVKRSSIRVRKETKNEKMSKELKGIFGNPTDSTKKIMQKKPIETFKKQNISKPELTKHVEAKKVIRSAKSLPKGTISLRPNKDIAELFGVGKKSVNKKSIDWSQYFGIDKRSPQDWLELDYLRRSESHFLPSKNKRLLLHDLSDNGNGNYIDKVENKIGDIEEKIIDDALKYTGAHTQRNGDVNRVKSKVIQRLEAAYSLEKMKSALEEFKNLIKPDTKVMNLKLTKNNPTESPKADSHTTVSIPKQNSNLEKPLSDQTNTDTSKRVATKKEVEDIFGRAMSDNLEFLGEPSEPNGQYDNEAECPVLDKVLHNCLRIEELSGKYAEILTPLCSLQQICYFCGTEIGFTEMSMCDSMYLAETQNICQDNGECLINAKDSLMGLRDLYQQELTNENSHLVSGSCLSNSCIQKYFLNSPGAIYPIRIQN